jgi:hypothetical protein
VTKARAVAAAALALAGACAHSPTIEQPARAMDTRSCAGADAGAAWSRLRDIPSARSGGGTSTARQEAELALGRGLYCMGFYSEAMAIWDASLQGAGVPIDLDRSVADALASRDEAQAAHPIQPIQLATLRSLALLGRRFPDWYRPLDAFAVATRADLDRAEVADVRDDLLYLGGLARYRQGRFKEARAFLAALPPKSPFFIKAKLYEGASHVHEYHGHPANRAFAAAMNALLLRPERDRLLIDLANLAMARTFYSMGELDVAANRYDAIAPGSAYWNERLLESAWTEYRRGNHAATLERLRALEGRAETARPEAIAEGLQLEAAVLLAQGDRAAAAAAIDRFNAAAPALFHELKTLLQTVADDAALYDLAVRARAGTAVRSPAVDRAVRIAASDRALTRRFDFVGEVQSEIDRFEKADPSWKGSGLGRRVQADLTARKAAAVTEAGSLLRRRLDRSAAELAVQITRLLRPAWEPLRGQR